MPAWGVAIGALLLLAVVSVILVVSGVLGPALPGTPQAGTPEVGLAVPTSGTPGQSIPAGSIIVDNSDPKFVVEAGYWGTCENGYCQGTCYGADFRYAEPGCTSCRAWFEVEIPTTGEYDVWTWWPQGEDRATDTPVIIRYTGDELTFYVDQRRRGSAWHPVTTLGLKAGETVRIMVEGTVTGYANADAVALTPAGSWQPE
jgi:hypothetical protein